jgi:hypothetical protein
MDNQTWQSRLEQNKQRRHRQKRDLWLLIAFFTILLGTWLWYFFIYAHTPEYALNELQASVTDKDRSTFERYINLDKLTSKAYDDLTVDFFTYDKTLTQQTRNLFDNFYVLVKPQITAGTTETILRRVASGEWLMPEGSDILKGRQLGIDYERILERSQIRNTEIITTGKVHRNGQAASAEIEIRDAYTQTPFTLQVGMEQADDGHWQVTSIKNYRAYLDTIVPLQNNDIANYIAATKPIVDSYNKELQKQQNKFHTLIQTSHGQFSQEQRASISTFLENEVIATLTKRQQALDDIEVPPGAKYLSAMRQQSTDFTNEAWHHFATGILNQNQEELEIAETLHKQELETDSRINSIIRHMSIAQAIPEIP